VASTSAIVRPLNEIRRSSILYTTYSSYICIRRKIYLQYDDKMVNIRFLLSSTSIDFIILNKANQSIKIDWNDVTIVQLGTTCRAVHNGVKLTNRNETQPPSTIPSNATLDDGVTPADNINWSSPSTYYAGGWQTSPLLIGGEIRLYLPIQYQNKTIEYNITFNKITNVTKP